MDGLIAYEYPRVFGLVGQTIGNRSRLYFLIDRSRVITGITVLILISFGNLVVGIGYVYFFRYTGLRNSTEQLLA